MRNKNMTIIGGSGGMGQVFSKLFKNHDIKITLNARNEEKLREVAKNLGVDYEISLKKSVKDADFVMISIPINSTPNMIRKVAEFMKDDALLFDITSLKHEVYKALKEMSENYPINCLSIHPMFGPGIRDLNNYIMLVLNVGGTEKYEDIVGEFLNLFESEGLKIIQTTPELHDKRIAATLGIPHMLNILFLSLLRKLNVPLSELTNYTGTTFLLQKVFAESIIQREIEMFGDIQMENEKFHEIIEEFLNLIKHYKNVINDKDTEGFVKIFTQNLNYSKEDLHFKDSYNYFYKFMKILKKES